MLEVKEFSFAYKHSEVLSGVTFAARFGEMAALLGKNGAGKTTLFRGILGFLPHYGGAITLGGENIKNFSARELAKKIAYVPQSHTQTFNYQVLLVVTMGFNASINAFHGPSALQEKEALDALESLGIAHLAARGYAEISGGERQLVLIARALVQKAKVFIMDEPAASLDYGNQIRVMQRIKEIAQRGFLVLLSTHNPEHVLLFADNVIVIKDGSVAASGRPRDALTAELLERVYGVAVAIHHVGQGDSAIPVCLPRILA